MAFLLRPLMHQACSLDVYSSDLVWVVYTFPHELGLLLILKQAAEREQNMQWRKTEAKNFGFLQLVKSQFVGSFLEP